MCHHKFLAFNRPPFRATLRCAFSHHPIQSCQYPNFYLKISIMKCRFATSFLLDWDLVKFLRWNGCGFQENLWIFKSMQKAGSWAFFFSLINHTQNMEFLRYLIKMRTKLTKRNNEIPQIVWMTNGERWAPEWTTSGKRVDDDTLSKCC